MIHQVFLTDRAAGDLEEAYRRLLEYAPETAGRWYGGFLDALESLSRNPKRCQIAPESRKMAAEIRQLLYGRQRSYRALFCLHRNDVVVLHIRHTARREAGPEDLL